MNFGCELIKGTLVRRYKRFLADIRLADGTLLTAHCPNTGAMTGSAVPGSEVWCSVSTNPSRKYPHTLEVVCVGEHRIVVNTGRANPVIIEAFRQRRIQGFERYSQVQPEVRSPDGTCRFDVLLRAAGEEDCYVEIKSMTLLGADLAGYFPDAPSERARKHVESLVRVRVAGCRAALFFCVQHTGITRALVAATIDPHYAAAVRHAVAAGVEIHAFSTRINESGIEFDKPIPFVLDPSAPVQNPRSA